MAITTHHSPDLAPPPQGDREERALPKEQPEERKRSLGRKIGIAAAGITAAALAALGVGMATSEDDKTDNVVAEAPATTEAPTPTTEAPTVTTNPVDETPSPEDFPMPNYAPMPENILGEQFFVGGTPGPTFEILPNAVEHQDLIDYGNQKVAQFEESYFHNTGPTNQDEHATNVDFGVVLSWRESYTDTSNPSAGSSAYRVMVANPPYIDEVVDGNQRRTYFAQWADQEDGTSQTQPIVFENWGQPNQRTSLGSNSLVRIDDYLPDRDSADDLAYYGPPGMPWDSNPWGSVGVATTNIENPNEFVVAGAKVIVTGTTLIDVLNPHFETYVEEGNKELLRATYTDIG